MCCGVCVSCIVGLVLVGYVSSASFVVWLVEVVFVLRLVCVCVCRAFSEVCVVFTRSLYFYRCSSYYFFGELVGVICGVCCLVRDV